MDTTQHNSIVNFIWSIADDELRDVYVRGKYRDVILPMTVIRRLDALLEPTKDAVLQTKEMLDEAGVLNQGAALCAISGQKFYNTSAFTLRRLLARPRQLRQNFEAYLDGFSENVGEIIQRFSFRNQLTTMSEADVLGHVIEKFISPRINLSPVPVVRPDTGRRLPGLTNHGMGSVFEELLRRFNEENNEEAGEHFTPREVVHLMTRLLVSPVEDQLVSGAYFIYDCACGTGGMLTEAEHMLQHLGQQHDKRINVYLYGQEVNAETYAICKADLLIKGDDEDNIRFGSTLSADAFPGQRFDFMLANPPYGKSWASDKRRMGGSGIRDPRFIITHADSSEYKMLPRSSDGQLLFLVNMLSRMKGGTTLGSRVATIHNGSSLFTGGAGSGESNIRRWIIENDWLEAIIGLPENLFYNTGIATYVWVLTNRKPARRRGKVQLIDARRWFVKLRRNLGQKNCELSPENIERVLATFRTFETGENSKLVDNDALGYWKVTVERPLRLKVDLSDEARKRLKAACDERGWETLPKAVRAISKAMGAGPHLDFNAVVTEVKKAQKAGKGRWSVGRWKALVSALCEVDPTAEPVVKKREYGRVIYEPDTKLRDSEQIPLDTEGGIDGFVERKVLPYVPDAWIDEGKTQIGYEIPFNRHFYRYEPPRPVEVIAAEIRELESGISDLMAEILS